MLLRNHRATSSGELAAIGRSRMAGAGAFPSPIAHATRLEVTSPVCPFQVLDLNATYFHLFVLQSSCPAVYDTPTVLRSIVDFLYERATTLVDVVACARPAHVLHARVMQDVALPPHSTTTPRIAWCEIPPRVSLCLNSYPPGAMWTIRTWCDYLTHSLGGSEGRAVAPPWVHLVLLHACSCGCKKCCR